MNKEDIIAIVMGGPSAEAEISRMTGNAVAEALRDKDYNVKEIELDPQNISSQLRETGAKIVFNAVHGMYGEDGRLQGILDSLSIPYTGSKVLGSAVAFDKTATKRFLLAEGVQTPECLMYRQNDKPYGEIIQEIFKKFSLPVVIKAAEQGSSIGVSIIHSEDEIAETLKNTFKYSDHILVEKCIKGQELTVALMEDKGNLITMPIILIKPHSGAYDFTSKYTRGATEYLVPAPLDKKITTEVQELAKKTYKILSLSGVARIDIMLGENGQGYVLEANTIPGMTATSLVPRAAAAMGINFSELCEMILENAK
ncbi:MAG: D-alanine--D-alanine ligase [Phascolarctobacterium sp.]|nr:D-alanine--D-alanine ligase [Phascolarctobacterium sp.]